MIFRLYVLFFLLTLCSFGNEYGYTYTQFGVNEGLPSSQVFEIIEDKHGYIWFGTDAGLVKYNGLTFKTFTRKDGLSSDVIFHLAEAPDGKIWLYNEACELNYIENDIVHVFKYNESMKELISVRANLITLTATKKGLSYFAWSKGSEAHAVSVDLETGVKELEVENGIHFETLKDKTVISLNVKRSNYSNSECDVFLNGVYQNRIVGVDLSLIFADAVQIKEIIYFNVSRILYQMDLSNNSEIKIIDTFDNDILNLEKDKKGNLYISMRHEGLWMFPKADGSRRINVIKDVSVSNTFIDQNGGIWIATLFNGLYHINSLDYLFFETPEAIVNFKEINREIFYATGYEKVFKLTGKESQLSKEALKDIENFKRIGALKYIRLLNDGLGILTNSAMSRIPKQGQEKTYLFPLSINGLIELGEDSLIIATENGLRQIDNRHFTVVEKVGANNLIYTATKGEHYRVHPDFDNANLTDIIRYNDTIMVVASSESGLLFKYENGNGFVVSDIDGLISYKIRKLYTNDGYIAAISTNGISIIDKSGDIINFTDQNGLNSNDVKDVFIRNDSIWVATDLGISNFAILNVNPKRTSILLNRFEIGEDAQELKGNYKLLADQNSITIGFETIYYKDAINRECSYQLKGIDENWVTTTNKTIRYRNLPHGNFSFWVKFKRLDKSFEEPICLFELSKAKSVSEYFIVQIGLAFGAIVLIWFFIYRRYRRFQMVEKNKCQMLNMERKTLQAQMNPHFIFNSLTSLQSLIIDDKKFESQEYLGRFAQLTRKALNHSTKNVVFLKEEIEFLRNYIELEQIRYANSFEYKIINKLETDNFQLAPMLLQPFIENAILHGLAAKHKDGRLKVEFIEGDKGIVNCIITDNGSGRKLKKGKGEYKSLGIQLVRERLGILMKMKPEEVVKIIDLEEEGKPSGTKVIVLLPKNG